MAHKARRRATACPTMGLWRATDSNMGVTDSVSTWGCLGNNIDAPDAVYKIDATYEGSCIDFWSRHRLRFPKHPLVQSILFPKHPQVHRFLSQKIVRCIDFVSPNILRCIDVISQTTRRCNIFLNQPAQFRWFCWQWWWWLMIIPSHSWVHLPQTIDSLASECNIKQHKTTFFSRKRSPFPNFPYHVPGAMKLVTCPISLGKCYPESRKPVLFPCTIGDLKGAWTI